MIVATTRCGGRDECRRYGRDDGRDHGRRDGVVAVGSWGVRGEGLDLTPNLTPNLTP